MKQALGIVGLLLLGCATAVAQQASSPPCTTSEIWRFILMSDTRESPEELMDTSKFIVDAIVQSTGPGLAGPRLTETGALLTVTNVLKGRDMPPRFSVSRTDRNGLLEMRAGQRFILFLNEEQPGRQHLSQHPDVTNYRTDGVGHFCVENGRIMGNGGMTQGVRWRGGTLAEPILDEIRSYVALPRIVSLIQMEGGASLPAVVKVVLRQEGAKDDDPPLALALMRTLDPPIARRIVWIERTGEFTLALDTGDYRIRVEGLPPDYILKSMTYGAVDLTKEPLRISGPSDRELRILLTGKTP